MIKIFRLLILGLLICLNFKAIAACSAIACTGKGKEVLLSIYPNSSGSIYLQGGAQRNNLNCTLREGHYMTLKKTHANFDEIFSTLLTGIAMNKRMTIRIKTGSPDCEVSYVRMFI